MIGALYTQSAYSMLNSTLQLEAIFLAGKERNLEFIALSDEKNLHGLYKFLKLAKMHEVQPIVGLKVSLKHQEYMIDFLLYARNDDALKALIGFSSKVSVEQVFDLETLKEDIQSLVVVLPTNQSFITDNYLNEVLIEETLKYFKRQFKDFYLGLSLQSDTLKHDVAPSISSLARQLNILMLPVRKTAYLNHEDKKIYEVLRKIENIDETVLDEDMSFASKNDLLKEFKDYKEVFTNLDKVFSGTAYHYLNNHFELPVFPTKDNVDAKTYLSALATLGLKRRLEQTKINDHKVYQERLNYELSVISKMGYDDYFLIVYDFVRFAKTNDILVGPGRGSVAGSLVAYCLGITEVNPIEFDLLFERFLNIERQTMPDIDMDFPDNKRDLVIDYVKNKYGKNHVVTISTFTTFAERSSIRDIARIMKLDQTRTGAIIKSMSRDKIDPTDLEAVELIRIAKQIEGLPRQTGTHAAGIILSKEDLTPYVPLQGGPHDMLQSQFDAYDLEAFGFLKIDFLGLRNLSIVDDVLKMEKISYKLSDIPLDDKPTYETLKNVETTGIFQLESSGMRNVIRKLQPDNFEDIVALLALFRPGPLEFIDDYIKRRHGATYELVDPSIDNILKPTYGIIVYQEQIMKIATSFAGYPLSEADLLRRGIAKKDKDIIEKEKHNFIKRAVGVGKDKKAAEKIYDYIERFADYGFNRSHSVAYALLAYQMAYLKTHYFKSFMAVLLSSVVSNAEAVSLYVDQLRQKNIKIYKPDIRYSDLKFVKYQEGILCPLVLIKGIGANTVEKIVAERSKNEFKNYADFKFRMQGILNQKSLVSLIHSGALDAFGLTHASMIAASDLEQSGFENFLDDYKAQSVNELSFDVLKQNEQEVLGFNLYYVYDQTLEQLQTKYGLKPIDENRAAIKAIVKVIKVKEITTKSNDKMAFVDLDGGIKISGTVFPGVYQKYKAYFDEAYLLIEASKDTKGYIIHKIEKVTV